MCMRARVTGAFGTAKRGPPREPLIEATIDFVLRGVGLRVTR